jgi:hypothetical protein
MLSLAKLRGGTGATYWLAQAQGWVTHAESVSSGVEDYYLAGPEAAGRWMGGGVAGLELGGAVEEVALTRLLDRQHPRTGAALPRPRRGRPPEVDGFDLMFSVPKSASVLFGLGGPRARGAVVRVQQAAVEEAMRYLDREACLVRVGPERELQRGGGLVGAAFEHRTSRAGDPQLHTHVLVANGTFGAAARGWRWMGRRSTTTRGRPVTSTRRLFGGRWRSSSGWSGGGRTTASPMSAGSRLRSCGRFRLGRGRSTSTWSSTAGAAARRGRSRRCARARPRTTTWPPRCCCPSGASAPGRSGWTIPRCGRCWTASATVRWTPRPRRRSPTGWRARGV